MESTRKLFQDEELDKIKCSVKRKEENMSLKVMIKRTNIDKFLQIWRISIEANITNNVEKY